jgi:hypothetical protein
MSRRAGTEASRNSPRIAAMMSAGRSTYSRALATVAGSPPASITSAGRHTIESR